MCMNISISDFFSFLFFHNAKPGRRVIFLMKRDRMPSKDLSVQASLGLNSVNKPGG